MLLQRSLRYPCRFLHRPRPRAGVGEEKIWGAAFGVLFGLTEATSDIALKFNLSGVF